MCFLISESEGGNKIGFLWFDQILQSQIVIVRKQYRTLKYRKI